MWSNEWSSDGEHVDVDDEEIAECIGIPASKVIPGKLSANAHGTYPFSENFQLRNVQWAPDGKGLLLLDRDIFCCAFEVEQDDDDEGNP